MLQTNKGGSSSGTFPNNSIFCKLSNNNPKAPPPPPMLMDPTNHVSLLQRKGRAKIHIWKAKHELGHLRILSHIYWQLLSFELTWHSQENIGLIQGNADRCVIHANSCAKSPFPLQIQSYKKESIFYWWKELHESKSI